MTPVEILHEALLALEKATEAIDAYAKENHIIIEGDTVSVKTLAAMVAAETGKEPECVFNILDTAFGLIESMDLTIGGPEDES